MKKAIRAEYEKLANEKLSSLKKLRFLRTKARYTYLLDSGHHFREALIVRLNMAEIVRNNFGFRGGTCSLCGGLDSTEHVLECPRIRDNPATVDDLRRGQNMINVAKRFATMEWDEVYHIEGIVRGFIPKCQPGARVSGISRTSSHQQSFRPTQCTIKSNSIIIK